MKQLGIADRLREPKIGDSRTESYISFRHRELKKDGSAAEPLRIVDADNNAWSGALIGNGSKVDVKFVVKDYGVGKKKGVYIRAIRVLDLVPYVSQDFAPLSTDDEFFSETDAKATEFARLPDGMEPLVGGNADFEEDDLNDGVPE